LKTKHLLALRLYMRSPFGRLHGANPDIMALANKIGRTPNALRSEPRTEALRSEPRTKAFRSEPRTQALRSKRHPLLTPRAAYCAKPSCAALFGSRISPSFCQNGCAMDSDPVEDFLRGAHCGLASIKGGVRRNGVSMITDSFTIQFQPLNDKAGSFLF
jgi:hypothetical protein